MKKMLLILHCLQLGGALNSVLALARELSEMGYELEVVSRIDGDLRQKFEAMGISVEIYEDVTKEDFFTYVEDNYQQVFVNTLLLYSVVWGLNRRKVRVHWWIHEPPMYFNALGEAVSKSFWDELENNVKVYAAGDFVGSWIRESYGCECNILNFGVRDVMTLPESGEIQGVSSDKITFLVPSVCIQYVKGQDLMAEAILGLPKEYAECAEFLFLGGDSEDEKYYQFVREVMKMGNNMKCYPVIEWEELMKLMKCVDCVAAPSREDATNACIVEGLMLSKLCLCSDSTGVSRYMEDCVNGFIFQSGNVEDLRARIMLIIDNFDRLNVIARNGRKVYEEVFSMEVFAKNVRKYW